MKAKENSSDFIKRGKARNFRRVYTFLNVELQNIHAQLLVRCCRKSQSQTEASDLKRDCVHAIMILFTPAKVQEGQSYRYPVLWNSLAINLRQAQTL